MCHRRLLLDRRDLFAQFPGIPLYEVGELRHTKDLFFVEAHCSRAVRSLITNNITCDSPDQLSLDAGQPTRSNPFNPTLGMNKDGREKDTDARRLRRCIDDRRRDINSFHVAIRPINAPAPLIHIVAAVITTSSVLVSAVVMFSPFIFAEGRCHVYTADHCG